ncbi:MAG: entericidin A/B family lipoprotein [Verrucomicrobiota bacterium]
MTLFLINRPRCLPRKASPFRIPFLVIISCLLIAIGLSSSCHTVEGVGKDVKRTGHSIEKAAS